MSPSLPIDLDRSSALPLYRQIEHWIRHAIDGGRLPPGTRLPGVRTLARDLGVSVVPVINAYEQLGAEGYLETRVGLGTMVVQEPPTPMRRAMPGPGRWRQARLEPPTRPAGRESLGTRPAASVARVTRATDRRQRGATPRPVLVAPSPSRPAHDRGHGSSASARDGDDLGLGWLRAMLALRVGPEPDRGARLPDEVIVTAGVQAGLAAVARTWLGPERTCARGARLPGRRTCGDRGDRAHGRSTWTSPTRGAGSTRRRNGSTSSSSRRPSPARTGSRWPRPRAAGG